MRPVELDDMVMIESSEATAMDCQRLDLLNYKE